VEQLTVVVATHELAYAHRHLRGDAHDCRLTLVPGFVCWDYNSESSSSYPHNAPQPLDCPIGTLGLLSFGSCRKTRTGVIRSSRYRAILFFTTDLQPFRTHSRNGFLVVAPRHGMENLPQTIRIVKTTATNNRIMLTTIRDRTSP
jgi:hypothetical protein